MHIPNYVTCKYNQISHTHNIPIQVTCTPCFLINTIFWCINENVYVAYTLLFYSECNHQYSLEIHFLNIIFATCLYPSHFPSLLITRVSLFHTLVSFNALFYSKTDSLHYKIHFYRLLLISKHILLSLLGTILLNIIHFKNSFVLHFSIQPEALVSFSLIKFLPMNAQEETGNNLKTISRTFSLAYFKIILVSSEYFLSLSSFSSFSLSVSELRGHQSN